MCLARLRANTFSSPPRKKRTQPTHSPVAKNHEKARSKVQMKHDAPQFRNDRWMRRGLQAEAASFMLQLHKKSRLTDEPPLAW